MTRGYQEQMTARAKENNLNPLYGVSSEGYKGKGLSLIHISEPTRPY